MKTGLLYILIALLLPSAVMAQATIKGQVTDLMTDKPLPGVRVDLRTTENTEPVVHREVWTDAKGRYRLDDVPAGRWRVRALLMMPDADRILVSPPADVSRKSTVFNFKFPTGRQHRPAGAGILSEEPLDTPSSDKIEVTGRVVDAFTAVPLAGATVRLMVPQEATTGGTRYQTQGKARTDRQGQLSHRKSRGGGLSHPRQPGLLRHAPQCRHLPLRFDPDGPGPAGYRQTVAPPSYSGTRQRCPRPQPRWD